MTRHLSHALRAFCALALLALAVTNAAAQQHSTAEKVMLGTWYGEFAPGPKLPLQRFINVRNADGTFVVRARMYEGGKVVAEVRNAGLWGISNGMYFTVITEVDGRPSDPKRPEAVNAYLVKSLDADRFAYVHVASGGQFVVTRIDPANARLPD